MTEKKKSYPKIIQKKCSQCGLCYRACKEQAIKENKNKYTITNKNCIQCGHCIKACPVEAISYPSSIEQLTKSLKEKKQKQIIILADTVFSELSPESLPFKLETIGFDKIFDLSFGYKITLEYYKNQFLKKRNNISSICPVVNSKIKKESRPLNRSLIHIQNPHIILGEIIKKQFPEYEITYVTPCFAAIFLNSELNIYNNVITIKELSNLLNSLYNKRRANHKFNYEPIYINRKQIFLQKQYISSHLILSKNISQEDSKLITSPEMIHSFIKNKENNKKITEAYYCKDGCIQGPGCSSNKNSKEKRIELLKWNETLEKIQEKESVIKRKIQKNKISNSSNDFINIINIAIKQIQHPAILNTIIHQIHTFADILQKEVSDLYEIKEKQKYRKLELEIQIQKK